MTASAKKVLVAGIGNVFLGDDGFGVEVARRLAGRALPDGVEVRDFGIRGIDLAFALERCDAAILVDAAARGGAPGTLYVIEPERASVGATPDGHAMTPGRVLSFIAPQALPAFIRLVACEPATFGPPDVGQLGLSPVVDAAVDGACDAVTRIVEGILGGAGDA